MGKQVRKLDENYPDPPSLDARPEFVKDVLNTPMIPSLPEVYEDVLKTPLDIPLDTAIWLTRDQAFELSKILGRNMLTAGDLIAACERLTNCSVDGTEVHIEPGLLIRLKSRAGRTAFPDYLRQTITRLLHSEAGW